MARVTSESEQQPTGLPSPTLRTSAAASVGANRESDHGIAQSVNSPRSVNRVSRSFTAAASTTTIGGETPRTPKQQQRHDATRMYDNIVGSDQNIADWGCGCLPAIWRALRRLRPGSQTKADQQVVKPAWQAVIVDDDGVHSKRVLSSHMDHAKESSTEDLAQPLIWVPRFHAKRHKDRFIDGFFLFLMLAHLPLSSSTLEYFRCVQVPDRYYLVRVQAVVYALKLP